MTEKELLELATKWHLEVEAQEMLNQGIKPMDIALELDLF